MVFAKNCKNWLRPSLIIQEVDKFALTLSVWHLWPGEFCCLMLLIQYVVLYLWSLHLFTVFQYPSVSLSSSLELSIWRTFSKPHQILPIPTSSVGNKFGTLSKNIFHKNREISILMMKKKPAARLTLHETTERSKLGKTKTNKKQKTAVWTKVPVTHLFRDHQQ